MCMLSTMKDIALPRSTGKHAFERVYVDQSRPIVVSYV